MTPIYRRTTATGRFLVKPEGNIIVEAPGAFAHLQSARRSVGRFSDG